MENQKIIEITNQGVGIKKKKKKKKKKILRN